MLFNPGYAAVQKYCSLLHHTAAVVRFCVSVHKEEDLALIRAFKNNLLGEIVRRKVVEGVFRFGVGKFQSIRDCV
jgi:hypothetical protein